SSLPTGLSINSSTGVISGTVGSGASTTTPYSSVVTVSDGTNSAVDHFTWYINPAGPVVVVNPGSQTNAAGDQVALQIQASDSNSGTLAFAAFGLPAGLQINTSTGAISGTVALGAAVSGTHTVLVLANDGTYSAGQAFLWHLSNPVSLTAPADQSNSEGDTVS